MNRRSTILLACLVAVMGVIALLSSRGGRSVRRSRPTAPGGLGIAAADITQVRVKRDYWSTFTLARDTMGQWRLTEPSSEEASPSAVSELLTALERFPIVSTIDLPGDDSERFHQYGLWEPSVELTIITVDGSQRLQLGNDTADGKGVYCALADRDGVMVTTQLTARTLSRTLDAYRVGAPAMNSAQEARVEIEDIRIGQGSPVRPGQRLTVHYSGRLASGPEFDSSYRRGQPFTLTLGAGEVIAGWEQGLTGMRVGGKRKLTIPPELGYGRAGYPPAIPADATLIFDIELLAASDR